MNLPISLQIVAAYLAARRRLTWSAERLRRYQEQRARKMVRFAYEHSPFYRAHWAGCDLENWRALPPVDKRLMMANFDGFTTRGVRADAAMQLALRAERERDFRPTLDGLTVGLSSGTSGHRGLFVVSPAEQAAWAGTILARVLPGLRPRARQATRLPQRDRTGPRRGAEGGEPSANAHQATRLPQRGAVYKVGVPAGGRSADHAPVHYRRGPSGATLRSAPERSAVGSVAGSTASALRRRVGLACGWWPPAWRGYRVAFFLRSNSNLYEQTSGRLVHFRYFDLMLPLADAIAGLNAFQPDIIVGPPSLLERLAACHSTRARQASSLPQRGAESGELTARARQATSLPQRGAVYSDGVPAGGRSAGGPSGATSVAGGLPQRGAVYEDGVPGGGRSAGGPSGATSVADSTASAQQAASLPQRGAVYEDGVPGGGRSAGGPLGATLRPRPRSGVVPEFGAFPKSAPERSAVGSVAGSTVHAGQAPGLPQLRCTPELLISVAEVLEPQSAAAIAEAFQAPVHQVYQCTEGLLAVSCALGALHIQEDLVALELEPLPEEGGESPSASSAAAGGRTAAGQRFTPIVTDLHRTTQPIIRYRLGDVLQLDPNPCACGSAFRVIRCIEGRADDVLYFAPLAGADGGDQTARARQALSLPQRGVDDKESFTGAQQALSLPQRGVDDKESFTGAQQASSLPQRGVDDKESFTGARQASSLQQRGAVYTDGVPDHDHASELYRSPTQYRRGGRSTDHAPAPYRRGPAGATLRPRPRSGVVPEFGALPKSAPERSAVGSVAGESPANAHPSTTLRHFYPDTLRRAVLLADGAIADYQVFQNPDLSLRVHLAVEPGADFACAARGVRASIAATLAQYGCRMVELAIEEGLAPLPAGAKRRRVQRLG